MASLKYTVDVDTRGARSSIGALQKSLGGIGTAVAGAFAVQGLVGFGDELISLRNRLSAFTSSQAEANAQFSQIAEIAGRSRAGLAETGALYNKMAIAADSMGISTAEVGRITETFAKSLKVGGANAQESASAILQFSQAMGSGVLRGEEFNAVFEASSSTMLDIAKAMNVPIGQMRELAREGKLTSTVISQAILKMTDSVEGKFAKTIPTMTEAFTNLKTAAGIALTEIANEGDSPAAAIGQLVQSLMKLTQDIPALTSAIKDLVNILSVAGIAFVAFKVNAFLAGGALSGFLGGIKNVTLGLAGLGGASRTGIAGLLGITKEVDGIKKSMTGLQVAFGKLDASRGSIMGATTAMGTLGTSVARVGQFAMSLTNILGRVLMIGLRFAGWVGVFLAVVDVVNLLYRAVTGSEKSLIDLGKIFKSIITVIRVFVGLQNAAYKAIWRLIGGFNGLYKMIQTTNPVLGLFNNLITMVSGSWSNLMSSMMNTGPMKAAVAAIQTVSNAVSSLWSTAKQISGVAAADSKANMDRIMGTKIDFAGERAAMGIKPKAVAAPVIVGGGGGGGGAGGGGGGGRSQAEINQELLKSINDITRAYREQVRDRLEVLALDVKLLGVSEDQADLMRTMADIDRNRRDTLAELADKELEIKENNELSAASRKKNLDIIAQQKAAVNTQAAEELAKTEELIRAKQRFAIEQERVLNLTTLQQQANENATALQNLEDQLKLVGLYGDALEDATAQIELQQRLREIEVEFQNQLLELENRRLQIGKERYAMELANIQAGKAQSIGAANAETAAQQKTVEARRKAERTDVRGAIRKRIEELERSVDPAVVALQSFDSVFNNMTSALDNFVETGKFKFKDFARSIISDLAKIALKAAATQLLTTVLGGIFGKAAGGPVMADKPYVVGEQGPELFVPNSAGSIMTNASMNKNAGAGDSGMQPIVNNTYINNNISALDAKSVAQLFAENRRTLFGAVEMAKKETPYRTV